jgi:cytoskeletal protein RodZ
MRKNEEGEFELVVGNRQLLSVLFVMFVLFGVVFSMGYFVGRNTAPEPATQSAEAKTAAAENPSQPRPASSQPAADSQAPPAAAADVPLAPGEAKVTASGTAPVGGAKAQAPATTPIPEVAPPTPLPAPSTKPPEKQKPATAEPAVPLPGQTYLQVAAVGKPEAELVVDVLKKRGFPALVAPVPNDTRWRALVGPLADPASLAKARSDLLAAGFKEVIVRKY